MPIGNAIDHSRTSFRGPSPRLSAAQPSNQASGIYSLSPASVDMLLDSISATDLEREVAHLVCRVHSPRSAMRVIYGFREAKHEQR
jgi:hypothetical protein